VISKVRRNAVEVDAEAIVASERPRQGQLTVAAAIPKGDRLKSMVEKLAELGVDRFVPLKTARSVADPRQSKLERLESTVVSAAKQCGLNWLMTIEPTQDLTAVLQQAKAAGSDIRIAHPGTRSMDQASEPSAEAGTLLLIGPEGGFTDQEIQLAADSGALPISWRGSILRIETAAVVFSALLIDQLERNW
jgi:16S rRNA (uracil1498-N3)-methyltransferase